MMDDIIITNWKAREASLQTAKEAFLKRYPRRQYFGINIKTLTDLLGEVAQAPTSYKLTPEAQCFIDHPECWDWVAAQIDFIVGTQKVIRITRA